MSADLYLVTGSAGFLGINLVRFLLARGHTLARPGPAPSGMPVCLVETG